MKLIIDIPEDEYNAIKNTAFVEDEKTIFRQNANDRKCSMGLFHIVDEVKNGTPIPDNATNGDVIKVMFSNTEIMITDERVFLREGTIVMIYPLTWWNAPYQKGEVNERP